MLNWGHLEEELACGTTIGRDPPSSDHLLFRRQSLRVRNLLGASEGHHPQEGETLVVENEGYSFHQIHADWLAFRADAAMNLGWRSDLQEPGRWYTASGDPAVQAIWWVDGWWGRAGPTFDDTNAEGHAVVLTSKGLIEVATSFGEITTRFNLERRGREDGEEVGPFEATRSITVAL